MPTNKLDLLIEDDTPGLTATVLFDYTNVHHNDEATVVAMLSITAPEVDIKNKRSPLNIVATIDVSTSMGGEKIRNAKESLKKMIEYLGPDDRLAVIAFHSSVFMVFDSDYMTGPNKNKATIAVDKLQATGWTNFSGALLQSFETMKKYEGKRGSVNRIIFFSDGDPTTGECDPVKILDMLDKAKIPEISLSTFGYGKDYDPELLGEMSKRGDGGHYLVENIEDCAAMFGTELGGLLSTYSQNLKVEVDLAEGVQLVEYMDTVYDVDDNVVTMPDILGGETKHMLVKVKLPKKTRAVCARPSRVIDFKVVYDDVGQARRRTVEERGQIQFVRKKGDVQTDPHPEVLEQIQVTEAGRTLERARTLADAGNLDLAREVVEAYVVSNDLGSNRYGEHIAADMNFLADNMDNDRQYRRVTRRRLVGSSHTYSTRRASAVADALFLNEAQTATRGLFVGDSGDAPDPDVSVTSDSTTSDSSE